MTLLRAALALAALAAAAWPQEAAKKPSPPCDAAAVEDGFWCPTCKKIREKEQLPGDKCKDCQSAPQKIKVCVKKWIPRCGMHDMQPHLEGCCKSKQCCKFEVVKHPVVFKCEGCGESSRDEAALPHKGIEHPRKTVKACEGSGTQPHGGEPIKKPGD